MLWRYHYAMTPPPIRHPVRIIGIDPGLRRTGWGVIETEGNRLVFIGCGSVEPPDDLPLANRLLAIHGVDPRSHRMGQDQSAEQDEQRLAEEALGKKAAHSYLTAGVNV